MKLKNENDEYGIIISQEGEVRTTPSLGDIKLCNPENKKIDPRLLRIGQTVKILSGAGLSGVYTVAE